MHDSNEAPSTSWAVDQDGDLAAAFELGEDVSVRDRANGNLLETRTHITDGELETTAAMCTSDGDVIIVGRVTPEP